MTEQAARTRHYCPLCVWHLDTPDPDPFPALAPEWLADARARHPQHADDPVFLALLAHNEPIEAEIRAHLETHPLEEWVAETMRLRGELAPSAAPVANARADLAYLLRQARQLQPHPPEKARLGRAMREGVLTSPDVSWVYHAAELVEAVVRELEPGALRSPADLPDDPPLFTTRRLFRVVEKRLERVEAALGLEYAGD